VRSIYYKEPTTDLYNEASKIAVDPSSIRRDDKIMGIGCDLKDKIVVHCRRSVIYFV